MSTINDAISAYKSTAQRANLFGGDESGSSQSSQGGGQSFGSMVKDAVASAVDAGKKSEAISSAAMTGKADMTEVAQAVNNADITLQSVVAIRDKVVSAYQQIMNMPI